MQNSWQDVNNLVDAESADANAQDNIEVEQVVGDNDKAGSSGVCRGLSSHI